MVAMVPPRAKQAGPGAEPTLSGPTRTLPLSARRIEPPPAPMLSISESGIATGAPSMRPVSLTRTTPSSNFAMSVVVPPISIETADGTP